jgi:hypothetical protein
MADLFDSTSMQSAHGMDGRRKVRQGPFLDVRQLDLFTAFVGDVPLRDDREAMSLPLCSLSKKKRITPIEWSNSEGTRWVKVVPTPEWGMATIWDLDVILWALSQLNEALERGMGLRSMLVAEVQAAACSSPACTGSPSRKRPPWSTWASRCEPSNRRQLRSADWASL